MLKVPVSSDVFIQRYTVILIAKVYHVEVELVNKLRKTFWTFGYSLFVNVYIKMMPL
jgi:hypothetical protein